MGITWLGYKLERLICEQYRGWVLQSGKVKVQENSSKVIASLRVCQ